MSVVRLRPAFVVLAVALVAAAALAVLRPTASAQDAGGRTLTFKELDRDGRFTHIRNTKTKSRMANSQGDILAFTNPLVDSAGARIGKLHAGCITTVGKRRFETSLVVCHGVVSLRDGTLMVQFTVTPAEDVTVGAVTGGTGAYANARGTVVSKHTPSGSEDTFTLVD